MLTIRPGLSTLPCWLPPAPRWCWADCRGRSWWARGRTCPCRRRPPSSARTARCTSPAHHHYHYHHHGHNYDHRGHYQHHQPALINECWHNFGPKLRAKIKAQIINSQKVYECHITFVPGPWSRGPTYPPHPWESWPGRWGPQPGGRDTEKLGNRGFVRWSILSVSYQYVGWHLLMLRRRVQPSCYWVDWHFTQKAKFKSVADNMDKCVRATLIDICQRFDSIEGIFPILFVHSYTAMHIIFLSWHFMSIMDTISLAKQHTSQPVQMKENMTIKDMMTQYMMMMT